MKVLPFKLHSRFVLLTDLSKHECKACPLMLAPPCTENEKYIVKLNIAYYHVLVSFFCENFHILKYRQKQSSHG